MGSDSFFWPDGRNLNGGIEAIGNHGDNRPLKKGDQNIGNQTPRIGGFNGLKPHTVIIKQHFFLEG